jgi:hypothetical protein
MVNTPVISRSAELLLTSSGITTDSTKERLFDMVRGISAIQKINVLRLADGWKPFNASDHVGRVDWYWHNIESWAARKWSDDYLHWSLGERVAIKTVTLGDMDPAKVPELLTNTNLLLVPGGNTYQVLRGIDRYKELIREAIAEGLPYVGESAGSIIAGKTIKPASLKPADICPDTDLLEAPGFDLIGADVLVHEGADGEFDINTRFARIARPILARVVSDASNYIPSKEGTPVCAIDNYHGLSIVHGEIQPV